jgi:hypothetical protein
MIGRIKAFCLRSVTIAWGYILATAGSPGVHAAPDGADLVYFAFVNYATLGYGDIAPVAEWRLLGSMAAMNGILLFGWSTAVIFEVLRRMISEQASREA